MNTTAMIYARLVGDAGLAGQLATHAGAPAVFGDRAPDAFSIGQSRLPCVVIGAATQDASDDTFTETRRAVAHGLRLYVGDFGSSGGLDAAAQAVRSLFDAQEAALTLDAGVVVIATMAGPIGLASSDAAVVARGLTLRLLIEEDV